MHAIETFSLSRRFGQVEAVRDLTMQIPEGAVYALMGQNGAGKTTLIKLLMNLLRPNSGHALILGADVSRLRGQRFEAVGYVTEQQGLPDWMTVGAFLNYLKPFYPSWDVALERRLVKQFDLPTKHKLYHLSRGMRMKTILASNLASRPRLILLDEPLSGLDPLVRDDPMHMLLEFAGEVTVLMSSHDLAEINSFATHAGHMESGRLLLTAPVASIRERFRKIQVTCSTPILPPGALPKEWLHFTVDGTIATWIETGYEPGRCGVRVREVFGAAQIIASAMTLRQVFLCMARADHPPELKAGRQ